MAVNPPIEQLIDIGERSERKLFISISGEGSPSVVLISGMGDTSEVWKKVQPRVARFTRVCSFDQPGLGQSDPGPIPATCESLTDDLRRLLMAAALPPPYILVAHSWMGLNARWHASRFPEEVAGLVLIDTVEESRYESFEAVLPAERMQRIWNSVRDPSRNPNHIDRIASMAQVRAARRELEIPVIVLTRAPTPTAVPPTEDDLIDQVEISIQSNLLALSTHSLQRFSKYPDHSIPSREPRLVVDAVRELVEQIRS